TFVDNNPMNQTDPDGLQCAAPLPSLATTATEVATTVGGGAESGVIVPYIVFWLWAFYKPDAPTMYPDPLYTGTFNPVPYKATSPLPAAAGPPSVPPQGPAVTTGFPGEDDEEHHRLPEQFDPFFKARGLDIENYKRK